MAYNLGTAFMDFTSGVLEADKKNTKDNLIIRGEELKAKRDAIISMKKSKYEYDMNKYDANKTKMDSLNAVSSDLDAGKFNYKKGSANYEEGKTNVDTFALGEAFLTAKYGQAWLVEQKKYKLGAEGDPTAWRAYVKQIGNNPDIQSELGNIDFKSRETIKGNHLAAIQNIEDKYAKLIKQAGGDSPLIKLFLGKKKEEIANLNIDIEKDKEDVKTISESNKYITKKSDGEISTDTVDVKEEVTEDGERVFVDSDATVFFPKSFKDEIKDEGIKVKDKLSNIDKDVVQTTYEIIKTETGSKDKDFVKFDTNTQQATSFTENGLFLNDQLKNLQIQIVDSMTPNYIFTTYNTTDANDVYRYLSKGDVQNILKTRVENYTGAESSEFIKKGVFSERESFIGFVPFSIVNLNDEFIIGTEGVSLKNADKKNVGKRYKDAVKLYVLNNYSHKNEQGVTVFDDNRTEQYWMNKVQEDLVRLKPNSAGVINSSLADSIKISMGVIKDKTVTTEDGSPKIISEAKTIDVVNYNGTEIKLTEKSKKQFEKDGVDWTKLEVINTISSQPETKKIKETKKIIESQAGDASIAEQIEANKVKEKIKPSDLGITNQPVFETLESILDILPNEMKGSEILEKYEVSGGIIFPQKLYRPNKVGYHKTYR